MTLLQDTRRGSPMPRKKPRVTATCVFTQGSGGQIPDGHQSRPKSNRHPAAMPPRDSSELRARTKHADRFAAVPDAGLDGQDPPETCDKPRAWPPEYHAEVRGRAARNAVCHAISRLAVKLFVRCLTEALRIPPQLRFHVIEKRAQGGARARVTDNRLPRRVSIQLGQQIRQAGHELLPLCPRQIPDSRFDFLDGAHVAKLPWRQRDGKLAADLAPQANT